MEDEQLVLRVRFYQTSSGREPVREWLSGLGEEDRKSIGNDLKTVQFGWPLGMPLVRKLEADLWEVRSQVAAGIARVLFTVVGNIMVLLHGFIKKSQKTPVSDLALARRRGDMCWLRMRMMNKHIGSDFDDYLQEQGLLAEATATANKRVLAYQIQQAMHRRQLSKTAMAHRMRTSRASLNRLLDPANSSVTLQTLERAAEAVGMKLRVELE